MCSDLKDFIPQPLDGDSYEGFETLTERANVWLKDQEHIVHVSFQSVLVQKGDGVYVCMSVHCTSDKNSFVFKGLRT